jgi:hypothetical protein
MALKYWFEFTDVKEIIHRVEISKTDFVGDSLQIYGSCSLEYSETDDTLEAVRGSGLRIDLEADSTLTFYDLYSEEERTFSVVYIRDNETLFNGWLSPEGIYESLVSDKWLISLDCTDGLGFLGNLSYVEDATGLIFVGKQSLLEIIVNCLKRTKTPQNILTAIDIYYDGLTQTLDPFANIYFNADRFVKEDNSTIMNCDEVLKSVLEPFGAVITAYKGEWLIYKPNSLVDSSSEVFFAYDSLGVALGSPSRTIDFALDLGSQIDSYYPHHANANQQKTVKSSIGAFRINYKYGLVKGLIPIDDFTLSGSSGGFLSTTKLVSLDTRLRLTVRTVSVFTNTEGFSSDVVLKITDGTDTYYYDGSDWVVTLIKMPLLINGTFVVEASRTPILGDISISIPGVNTYPNYLNETGEVYVDFSIDIVPNSTDSGKEGENHTFQRTLKPSSKIKDIKEVFNGDDESDIYVGTIYKADETTTTDVWTRFGAAETKPILQIMGEERMKMYSKPLQVYSGDVYGYFNYLSLFTINNLTGKFMPTKYNYDALTNITSLELTEVLNTDVLADIDYAVTFDYGNVVEPTITG